MRYRMLFFIGWTVSCCGMEYLHDPSKLNRMLVAPSVNSSSFKTAILRNDRPRIEYFIRTHEKLDQEEVPKLIIAAACRSNYQLLKYLSTTYQVPVDFRFVSDHHCIAFNVTALWAALKWGKDNNEREQTEQKKVITFLLKNGADARQEGYSESNNIVRKLRPLSLAVHAQVWALKQKSALEKGELSELSTIQNCNNYIRHYQEIMLLLLRAGASPACNIGYVDLAMRKKLKHQIQSMVRFVKNDLQ